MEKNTNVNDKINKFNFDIYEVYYLLLFLLRLYKLYEEDKENYVYAIKDYYHEVIWKNSHYFFYNKSRFNYLFIYTVLQILSFNLYFLNFGPFH